MAVYTEQGKKSNCKQNFANDKEKAAEAGKKSNKTSSAVATTINNNLTTSRKLITPEVQQYIKDELNRTNTKGETYTLQFVKKFLKEALSDPSSKPGLIIANILFKDDLLDRLDFGSTKSISEDLSYQLYKIRQTLYDKQQEVFDNNIDKQILIINSRRSGKSELLGRLAVKGLLHEDGHVVYINRSSSAAIRQISHPLETALKQTDLKIVKGSVAAQEVHFNNGSQLLVLGNNNAADINKLRGERISMCLLDEVGHQKNMSELIREVIGPALKDYADSQLVMVGTPPRNPGTYVEKCWESDTWKKYHWTFLDNPFIPNRENVISDVCRENGCTEDSAFIQREYKGILGVYDSDAMIFKGYKTHSLTPEQIKTTVWDRCYVSVDWGFNDHASIVVSVVSGKNMYVIWDWAKRGCATSDTMKMVKETYDKYNGELKLKRAPMVICDTNPKENVYELAKTYGLPAYSAYKHNKDMAIDQLACWLRTGAIQIPGIEESWLKHEAETTLWKRDPDTDKITHVIDDDFAHPDSMMALLYASRQFDNDVLMTGNSKGAKDILEAKPRKEYYDEEGYDYEVI